MDVFVATCSYQGCQKPAGILIGYWVFEDNRCRPFRLDGNYMSCEGHAPDVAVQAFGERLVPDSSTQESLIVTEGRISPNKVLVYRLGRDSFMEAPQHSIQNRIYEILKTKLAA